MQKRVRLIVGTITGCLVAVAGLVPSASADTNPFPGAVYVDPAINVDDPVVVDGDGIESCGPYAATGPLGGGWSREYSWIGCSYWGTTDTSNKYYDWYVPWWSSAQGCGQGPGYTYTSHTPIWRSLSCGAANHGTLLWGELAGIPKFKAKSLSVPLGAPMLWT